MASPNPLAVWLNERGETLVEFGAKVGANNGTISRLVRGERGPSLHLALAIERETGIPVSSWAEPRRRKQLRSKRRRS